MKGREFLKLAHENMAGADEVHRRGAVGRAYYAVMLECRVALSRWSIPMPRRENVHTFVRLRFSYAVNADLRNIGRVLERVGQLRNRADYDLANLSEFASDAVATNALQKVAAAIDLLDAIEADAVRKADAIKAIRAAFP
jgi:hypothetical protein